MLKELLYQGVDWVAAVHDRISRMNDTFEGTLSDKQLHFLVIGILGMMLIFMIYPLFRHLAKTNHIMVVSWIYVFTLILVITFAIEIGQRLTKTGEMEFADIVFGLGGFVLMFAVFAVIRGIFNGIRRLVKARKEEQKAAAAPPEDPSAIRYQGRHEPRGPERQLTAARVSVQEK